jgi:hypothetical protein
MVVLPMAPARRRARPASGTILGAVVLVIAAVAGLATSRGFPAALAVACIPLLLLALLRPAAVAVLGVGLTYVVADLTGGAGSVQVSAGDLLLALAVIGATLAAAAGQAQLRAAVLRPIALPLAVYAAALAVALAAHVDASAAVNVLQRAQIVLVPLIVGAVVLRKADLRRALGLYVVVTAAMAVVYVATYDGDVGYGNQKNAAGNFMSIAILIAIGSDALGRVRFPLIIPLAIGLFVTGSRGAILGLAVGLALLPLVRSGGHRRRTFAALLPVVACLALVYGLLPDDARNRISTVNANGDLNAGLDSAQYTIALRGVYRTDAIKVIRRHPLLGVGIGQYLAGDVTRGTLTNDPHDVWLLDTAEGGLPLGVALSVLLLGSLVVVIRVRRYTPLAALAASVQGATLAHGLVDIYWVRGTPTLGWLLIGAALADAHRRRRA